MNARCIHTPGLIKYCNTFLADMKGWLFSNIYMSPISARPMPHQRSKSFTSSCIQSSFIPLSSLDYNSSWTLLWSMLRLVYVQHQKVEHLCPDQDCVLLWARVYTSARWLFLRSNLSIHCNPDDFGVSRPNTSVEAGYYWIFCRWLLRQIPTNSRLVWSQVPSQHLWWLAKRFTVDCSVPQLIILYL